MFFSGKIRHSQSPWSSPVNLVKKEDGSLRTTVDNTELNARTVKDAYPIPLIEPIIDQLTGSAPPRKDSLTGPRNAKPRTRNVGYTSPQATAKRKFSPSPIPTSRSR
jgi:hypothetical protein